MKRTYYPARLTSHGDVHALHSERHGALCGKIPNKDTRTSYGEAVTCPACKIKIEGHSYSLDEPEMIPLEEIAIKIAELRKALGVHIDFAKAQSEQSREHNHMACILMDADYYLKQVDGYIVCVRNIKAEIEYKG